MINRTMYNAHAKRQEDGRICQVSLGAGPDRWGTIKKIPTMAEKQHITRY